MQCVHFTFVGMKGTINKYKISFRAQTTLFDSLIKPIALHGAPIWLPTFFHNKNISSLIMYTYTVEKIAVGRQPRTHDQTFERLETTHFLWSIALYLLKYTWILRRKGNKNKNCAHLPLFAGAIFPSPWLEVLVSTSTCFKWNAIKDAHSSHVIILKMQHLTRTHALNSFNLSFYFILLRCSLFYGNIISFKAQL